MFCDKDLVEDLVGMVAGEGCRPFGSSVSSQLLLVAVGLPKVCRAFGLFEP